MMMPGTLARLIACGALLALPLRAADLAPIMAEAAKYESGRNPEPLRQIEQLIRDTADRPAGRAALEAALAQLLTQPATFEARRFACQQLAAIGTDASLPVIAELLKDDETVGIACLALSGRRSPKAVETLRNALPAARGQARLQIIGALGNHQDGESVRTFVEFARDADDATAGTAILALGRIGTVPAREAIAAIRRDARPALASAVADATFHIAGQLAAAGDIRAATALMEEMLAPAQPVQIRRGALVALLRLDPDGGERRIMELLRASDGALTAVAIAGIPGLESPGASARFAAELAKLAPVEQALMIEALADRADAPARAGIREQLAASDSSVRVAAIRGMGRTGDASVVPALARTLGMATTSEEKAAVVEALTILRGGEQTDKAIAAEMDKSPAKDKAPLLNVLANRTSEFAMHRLLQETSNPDPGIARIAFRAVGRLGGASELSAMLERLASMPSLETRRDAETAVAQLLSNIENPSRRSDLLRHKLGTTTDVEARCSFLRLLPVAGSADALATLISAYGDPNARVADTAVRALADWRDATAWDGLLAIYRQPHSEAHRVLALRGLVRLAGAENPRPTTALVERYGQLLDGARGDNDRRLLLGALAGVAHPGALSLVLPLLSNTAVRPEAVLAVRRIAASIQSQHPQAAHDALQRLK